MKVLMISLEKKLFEDGQVRQRIIEQNKELEHLTILVFGRQLFDQMIAPNIRVVSTMSWYKVFYIVDAMQRLWFWRKEKFDVVTTQDPTETAVVGVFAARLFNAALAIQDHGYYFHGNYYRKESFLNFFRYWFARWVINRADVIRVVSLRTEEALVALGIQPDKIVRFPLVLNSSFTDRQPSVAIRHEPCAMCGKCCFLLAARFVSIKRIDLAIHAFSLIAAQHQDVKLTLIGSGPQENAIIKIIKEFDLENRVRIVPWTDDPGVWYESAMATLITSDREGFNMTAVESLICGTPVIMTDVGCAGEVVKDGENGFVVPVGDVHALADRMERVLQDPHGLREKVKGYIWEKPNVGMMEFYRKATKNSTQYGVRNTIGEGTEYGVRSTSELVRSTPYSVLRTKDRVRLLFVTQVVDKQDSVLGFVARWIEEFVTQGVKLTVFARILKQSDLTSKVITEELGRPKIRRIINLWIDSIKHRNEYDAVMVHMTPEILVMGWPVWFVLGKKVCLWYIHPHVSYWLRIAVVLSDIIFTATERSMNVKTKKKKVVGHGIDTDLFKPLVEIKLEPNIYYVGRISPVKRVEDIIEFLGKFHQVYPDAPWTFTIQGSSKDHEAYFEELMSKAAKLKIADKIFHKAAVAQNDLPSVYSNACVTFSATPTGSLDKVVLESLACGTPVFAAGKDYIELPGVVDMNDPDALNRLNDLLSSPKVDTQARRCIRERHDLRRLVTLLIGLIKG